MRRGDLVTVAVSGDYGKPCPALVVQSDSLPDSDSVLVCLLTSSIKDSPFYRLTLSSGAATGLRAPSQVMIDKVMAVRRDKCGDTIGRVDSVALLAVGRLLSFMIGLAD